jgi:hypothetical protein
VRSFLILAALATTAHADKLTPEQCKTEAAALGKFLADTPHDKHPLLSQRGFALARRTDVTTPVPMGPVINATRLETSVQGQLASSPADLKTLVGKHARGVKQVVVMLDVQVPWSRVVDIVAAVRNAKVAPVLVFQIETPAPKPPRSAYDDAMAASSTYPPKPGQKSAGRVLEELLAPCPALGTLLASARGEGVDRTKTILDGIAPALTKCSCSADLPSVRSWAWDLVVVQATAAAIVFDKPGTETLALPGDTLWGEATKLIKPGTSYTFAVK